MTGDKVCEKCGQLIPRGTAVCPMCANPLGFSLRRETALLLSFLALVILFAITGILVKQYHARERALGRQWYARGQRNSASGRSAEAIIDFRTALFHVQANPAYQLRLAQSLVDSGSLVEARGYLLRLWETDPADGPVNLELARLAMRTGDIPRVIRYYHSAIDGVWPPGVAHAKPRELRQALCEYLIDHNRRTEALAELTELSNETPNNARLRAEVASLFLKAQDYDTALEQFRRALRLNRREPGAWAGAGEAAFMMGNYVTARDYLSRAVIENPHDRKSAATLETAKDVIALNPFDRRVPASMRRKRAIAAFSIAVHRLKTCASSRGEKLGGANPQTGLQRLYAAAMKMQPQMRESRLRSNPDLLDSGMSLVFQIEQSATRECGQPAGKDLALSLIGSKAGAAGQ